MSAGDGRCWLFEHRLFNCSLNVHGLIEHRRVQQSGDRGGGHRAAEEVPLWIVAADVVHIVALEVGSISVRSRTSATDS